MVESNKKRIDSLDILRGIVMVIMALDHSRDFFHLGAFNSDPTDLTTTTPMLFATRFITHFCAPVFVFLTGTSAYLWGSKKRTNALFRFLITRGLWLIFVGEVVFNLIWWFDIHYSVIAFQVLWAIGVSMMCLSLIVYLPKLAIGALGFMLIAGHNLLDGITMEGNSPFSILWYFLHQPNSIMIAEDQIVLIQYPLLPWIGVMALGYCFGTIYSSDFSPARRSKWLLGLGSSAIVLFLLFRYFNLYGDIAPWSPQKNAVYSLLSFLNVTKYPPSFLYVLITLGPSFILLRWIDSVNNRITGFFVVFGRVPFFYYLLHALFIHFFALLGLAITGGDWSLMVITVPKYLAGMYVNYGYSLWITYFVWIGVVLLLYPLSKRYMQYKANHKDQWWLTYL